jgi:hypothetical protein
MQDMKDHMNVHITYHSSQKDRKKEGTFEDINTVSEMSWNLLCEEYLK